MASTEPFALLVPAILLVFGTALIAASRWGSRAAPYWGVGMLLSALGFVAPLLPVPNKAQAMIGEAIFLGAFLCYGHGLLVRLGRPPMTLQRLAFALVAYVAIAHAILIADDLRSELLISDTTCAVLLLWPMLLVYRHLTHAIDRIIFGVIGLAALDCVVRVALLGTMIGAGSGIEAYGASLYAAWAQASAGVISVLFALAALGTAVIDLLGTYRDAADRDALTGLLNRHGFTRILAGCTKTERTAAVILCDIDHFKRVNDAYGHAAGDRILVAVAAMLSARLPARGHAARFGGEEFVLFLPGQSPAEAAALAETIRRDLAAYDWRSAGIEGGITASFGIAGVDAASGSVEDAVARADKALYAAKADGRNQVALGEPPALSGDTRSRDDRLGGPHGAAAR